MKLFECRCRVDGTYFTACPEHAAKAPYEMGASEPIALRNMPDVLELAK